jgi:hypothetical protein
MNLKKFIVVALALPILVMGSALAVADAYDPLQSKVGQGNLIDYVVENGSVERNGYIAIMPPAVTSASQTRDNKWQWCTGLSDPICDPANSPQSMKANSILGPCQSPSEENCIDSVSIGTSTAMARATLIRVSAGLTFPANPKYNFPGSSTISLWSAPGAPSATGTTNYAVMPRLQLYFNNGRFTVGEMFTDVIPYKEVDGNYFQTKINPDTSAPAANRYLNNGNQVCVFAEDGVCGVAQDFAPDTRIKLSLRLSNEVGGWFQGRLKDPVMDVSKFSANNNLVTIQASSVTVPRMAFLTQASSFNDQENIWYQNFGRWPTADGGTGSGPQAGSPESSFPFIDYYRQRVNDTASGTNTYWNFSTTSWGSGSKCLQDTSRVLGIVSTNSMAYDGNSPSFINSSLDYHVSGLHFMPDGVTPVQGSYNLVMRSDVARCLYGFSSAPIKATISIAGSGSQTVATTVAGEANGWLSFAADGFTFSNKTIQVKLTQEAGATNPKVITKITCIKGKLMKVLSGVNPVCSAGYKKK